MSDSRLLPTGSSPLEVAAARAVRKLKKRRSVFVSCGTRIPVRQICCRGWRGHFRVDRWDDNGRKRQNALLSAMRISFTAIRHFGAIRRVVEPLGYLIEVRDGGSSTRSRGRSASLLACLSRVLPRKCIRSWSVSLLMQNLQAAI
ncbi:phage P2-related tail formation protein [Escherichia coli]|nr:phage P2-related tail formation protein [Escherichia coli]